MRDTTPRAPSRDESGRWARAQLEAAARMLTQRAEGDGTAPRPDPAFAASVRAADAALWETVEAGERRPGRPRP